MNGTDRRGFSMKFLFYSRGRPSMSKVWTNIAFALATYVVWRQAETIGAELLGVFLVAVGGYEVSKRIVEYKAPKKDEQ